MLSYIKMSRQKITISAIGPILPGSITTAYAQCGKENCACKHNPKRLHGPYYRWSGIIDGKRTTVTLSPNIAKECKRRIQNYKKLVSKLNSLISKSMRSAPWNSS